MTIPEAIQSVSVKTLGCKLNQSESDAIATKFAERGMRIVEFGERADLTVINTCTVTNDAARGSRAAIRQAIRNSPQGRIAVTGCYAQISPRKIEAIAGVDLILGSDEKYRIFDHLDKIVGGKLETPLTFVNDRGEFDSVSEDGFISATSRTRAFLKVQDGCDYHCTYCIIPFARGRARSRSLHDAIDEARRLADKGFQEIVITGINVGTYRWANGRIYNLADLLDGLQNVDGIARIRLSSIEPNTVTDELLALVRDSQVICPHLHIPLQSGHDEILHAMGRKYRLEDYARLMEKFRVHLPDAALGTDVIVGFPGETDKHFAATHAFITACPFTYLHIFRYSPRDGTAAVRLPSPADGEAAKYRSRILYETHTMMKSAYARRFIGRTLPVLFDHSEASPYCGYTPNYIRVAVAANQDLAGKIIDIRLTGAINSQVLGILG